MPGGLRVVRDRTPAARRRDFIVGTLRTEVNKIQMPTNTVLGSNGPKGLVYATSPAVDNAAPLVKAIFPDDENGEVDFKTVIKDFSVFSGGGISAEALQTAVQATRVLVRIVRE